MYNQFGISKNLLDLAEKVENTIQEEFKKVNIIA